MHNITTFLPLPEETSENNPNVNDILKQFDPYIVMLAKKQFYSPGKTISNGNVDIDELIQKVRIKLWQALKTRHINNKHAYISCIVRSVWIDAMRQKRYSHLLLDEDGELSDGNILITTSQGMHNPSEEFEEQESLAEKSVLLVQLIQTLPPCQQHAMLWFLKDKIDSISTLKTFMDYGFNVRTTSGPESKIHQLRSQASLSIARKKLRKLHKEATAS